MFCFKVTIAGEEYNMQQTIVNSIAAKATPIVHGVIADEVIRLGIGRREYRKVVDPLFNRIRDAIQWKDCKGARFCPQWRKMKQLVYKEMRKEANKATHTKKPDWKKGKEGCVWTEVGLYLTERLIAFKEALPQTYALHLKTIARRVSMVENMLPGV